MFPEIILPPSVYLAEKRLSDFELRIHGPQLRTAVRSAHLPMTVERYLRTCRYNAALAAGGIVLMGAVFIVTGFAVPLCGFSTSDPVTWLIVFWIVIPLMYAFQLYYPVILAHGRRTKIELDLPYAISYMQALSTTMPPYEMIHKVYEEHDMFGEISREFGMIVRDVELFGDDLITAMRNLQHTTPSPHLRDFLNDLSIVFDSGGDVSSYLGAKTEYYRDQARQELELVLKTIEIMAEVYVSAFVAGPIALIIMIVAQGMTNSQGMEWILPLMYIIIPAGAIVMIWILSLMLPPENLEVTRKEIVEHDFGASIPSGEPDLSPAGGQSEEAKAFFKRIEAQKQRNSVLNKLKNPLRTYITSYDYSLIAAMIITMVMAGLWYTGWFETILPHNAFEDSSVLPSSGSWRRSLSRTRAGAGTSGTSRPTCRSSSANSPT